MMHRKPTTPGEILREEFLVPLGLSEGELAAHIRCDAEMVEGIVQGQRAVGAEMALKLGASFRTSPDVWLAAQRAVDLYQVTEEGIDLPPPLIEDESR